MDGNWNWTDSSKGIYTNWDNVVDNTHEDGHDCVYIDKEEGKWMDEKCSAKKYFICKKKLESMYLCNPYFIWVLKEVEAFLISNF